MKTIILNGANGYVASNFIVSLLAQNYRVIALVRAGKKHSPVQRMRDALSEFNEGGHMNTENLQVYGYSLLDENFSIPEKKLEEMFSGCVDYFHFAASLKFDLKSKNEIFSTNIRGVENSIKIFSKYANSKSRFFFIGTAYSCGKFPGLFIEKFYPNEDISQFRNYYEQSKRFAENIIEENIYKNGLNGHIIRLSQVVGNNRSGVTKTDYGIFDFAKRIHNLAHRYPDRTVRVQLDPDSTQNLIPVDIVVDDFLQTVETTKVPVIMNFTAKNSMKNIQIINSICELLPINIVPVKSIHRDQMDALERVIAVGMSFTGSYIDTDILFDTRQRDSIISGHGEANNYSIYKMLEYFIDNLSAKKGKRELAIAV